MSLYIFGAPANKENENGRGSQENESGRDNRPFLVRGGVKESHVPGRQLKEVESDPRNTTVVASSNAVICNAETGEIEANGDGIDNRDNVSARSKVDEQITSGRNSALPDLKEVEYDTSDVPTSSKATGGKIDDNRNNLRQIQDHDRPSSSRSTQGRQPMTPLLYDSPESSDFDSSDDGFCPGPTHEPPRRIITWKASDSINKENENNFVNQGNDHISCRDREENNNSSDLCATIEEMDYHPSPEMLNERFEAAGQGRKLGHNAGINSNLHKRVISVPKEKPEGVESHDIQLLNSNSTLPISEEKRKAAAAALERLQVAKKNCISQPEMLATRQRELIKKQALKELEDEKRLKKSESMEVDSEQNLNHRKRNSKQNSPEYSSNNGSDSDSPGSTASSTTYYTCSELGLDFFTKEKIQEKIRQHIELIKDPVIRACQLIHTCNWNNNLVTHCVETLKTYLTNIMNHPNEAKYRKIRCTNKVFLKKVQNVVGSVDFLKSVGFTKTENVPGTSQMFEASESEEFWEYSLLDPIALQKHWNHLHNTVPIKYILGRNTKLILPGSSANREEVEDGFFELSHKEMKMEQELKAKTVNREKCFRTEDQRRKEGIGKPRSYSNCVIRVRFPNAVTLEGNFQASDTLSEVYDWVRTNLKDPEDFINFILKKSHNRVSLMNQTTTLSELGLPPKSLIIFAPENGPDGRIFYVRKEQEES